MDLDIAHWLTNHVFRFFWQQSRETRPSFLLYLRFEEPHNDSSRSIRCESVWSFLGSVCGYVEVIDTRAMLATFARQ
jgi:hypothetical protein